MAEYYKEAGSVTTANIKATSGKVLTIRVTNVNAAIRYFQIHDKATAPAGGDTALRSWQVPAGSATVPAILHLDNTYIVDGIRCATGIGFAWSTTDTTYTAATAADHKTEVNYN